MVLHLAEKGTLKVKNPTPSEKTGDDVSHRTGAVFASFIIAHIIFIRAGGLSSYNRATEGVHLVGVAVLPKRSSVGAILVIAQIRLMTTIGRIQDSPLP